MGRRVLAAWGVVVLLACLTACGDTVAGDDAPPKGGAGGVTRVETLPEPEDGRQWVSWHDLAVQVPEEWVVGSEPGGDWCADTPGRNRERAPYVAHGAGYGPVLAIGCPEPDPDVPAAFGPAPMRLWQTHVALEPADGADRTVTHDGWTSTTRTLGDARVRLLTDDVDATAGILESAVLFGTDQHGCESSSPAQAEEFVRPEPFDVTQVREVESISVCEYDRAIPVDEAGLLGSRRLTGEAADALLRGLQEAPEGGGPDRPKNCAPDMFGDTAVVVRLHHDAGTDDVHVYYAWCFGNGSDDGTTRRALTQETCAPLFEPPVVAWSYSSHVHGLCSSSP